MHQPDYDTGQAGGLSPSRLLHELCTIDEQQHSVASLLEQAERVLQVAPGTVWIRFDGHQYPAGHGEPPSSPLTAVKVVRPGRPLTLMRKLPDDSGVRPSEFLSTACSIIAMKLDLLLTHREYAERQHRLDRAYKLARIGTWEFDMHTHELSWSDATKDIHGFGPDYRPGLESTIALFQEGAHRDAFERAAMDAVEKEQPFDVELKIVSGRGDERWIRAAGEPEYRDGECVRFYGISQNVSRRRKAQEELQQSERRFRSLVQDGADLIAILDPEGNYIYVSPTSEPNLGIPAEQFIGSNAFDYVHPDDAGRLIRILQSLEPGTRIQIPPYRFRNGRDEWRWLETTLTNKMDDPAIGGLIANSRDITRHKYQQKKKAESLKEKETLLSEIHHRVKNNLAVVSGMLQLQAGEEEDPAFAEKLMASVVRIKTMANIHEQLYQSPSFAQLALDENIESLIRDIHQTLQSGGPVDLRFSCDPVKLNISQAIPCSLIVNEVVTNIFKHAFPDRDGGIIEVKLTDQNGEEPLSLSICDNGIGLPAGSASTAGSSLGMNLIDVLARQLEATYRYHPSDSGSGTRFMLQFPKCMESPVRPGLGS